MRLLDRLERRLEELVEGAPARGRLHPLDIARRLSRAMQAEKRIGPQQLYVGCSYRVWLAPQDFASLEPIRGAVESELSEWLRGEAADRGYRHATPLRVLLVCHAEQRGGTCRVEVGFDSRCDTVRAVLIGEDGFTRGDRFELSGDELRLGRRAGCDIHVKDAGVSSHHATLRWNGSSYLLEDTGSRNGTMLNGENIQGVRVLRSGDRLRIGHSTLLFELISRTGP